MSQATPWAILLTKWKDNNGTPNSNIPNFYQNLFTAAGTGTYNMTDYFDVMSHGSIDLSGSKIFGWHTLDQPQSAYVGNAKPSAGQLGRLDLIAAAKATATAAGDDLAGYYGVVVVMNTKTDLFGVLGGQAAVCDPLSLQPAVLGQEMGHGYGLQHSRIDGSTADYQDPWDTMSTWDGCYSASDPNYTLIGPGLCAANMRYMGWLDESRVWKPASSAFTQQILLRPLHDRSAPGNLAAQVPGAAGGFLLEFRVPEDWDAAFPRAAIFVHRLSDGHSYRMIGSSGSSDLVVGDKFTSGSESFRFSSFTSVHVDEINENEHFAKLTLSYRPAEILISPSVVGEIFGGVAVGGGGVIVVNGRPHPIEPSGPLNEVLAQVAAHGAAEQISDPLVQIAAKKDALARIAGVASKALKDLTHLETPPALTRNAGRSTKTR